MLSLIGGRAKIETRVRREDLFENMRKKKAPAIISLSDATSLQLGQVDKYDGAGMVADDRT